MIGCLSMVNKRFGWWFKNLIQSFLYVSLRSRDRVTNPRSIMFVCKGNVCRSAFAEYYMRRTMVDKTLRVRSCGLDVTVCSAAPDTALSVARRKGLNLELHRSKGYETFDFDNVELILAMEFSQYRALVELFPHKKKQIRLLREYAPFPENLLCNIHDPFGKSENIFEDCFSQIERAVVALCAECTSELWEYN